MTPHISQSAYPSLAYHLNNAEVTQKEESCINAAVTSSLEWITIGIVIII